MSRSRSILARFSSLPWIRNDLYRRTILAGLCVVFALLAIWPRHYLARTQMSPQDSSGGLSGVLAQAGALVSLSALVGNHAPIEDDLVVARSNIVLKGVVELLNLYRGNDPDRWAFYELKIRHQVDISAIRGSILQVDVTDQNPVHAVVIATDFVRSIRDRLSDISREETALKQAIANNRMANATTRLADAQAALMRFQTENKLAAPEAELGANVSLLASLQGQFDAKEVQLNSARQFMTPDNIQLKSLSQELESLKAQIAHVQSSAGGEAGPTLQGITQKNAQYFNLLRNVQFASTLYEVYTKYLEEVRIDDLSAEVNVMTIEPPFVEPARQYNTLFLGLLIVTILSALFMEFYFYSPSPGGEFDK